jgi:hypothetical protein
MQLDMFRAQKEAQARQQEAALEVVTGHNITAS